MIFPLEPVLIIAALLLIVSVLASKISDRFGIPVLLIFLGVGMLAGSDGPGGIYFDNPLLAQYVGAVALVIILFSGGLDTHWPSIRPVLRPGTVLATLGVVLTAGVAGLFIRWILGLSWVESLLMGAIISSTDAAAVFAVLRARGVRLQGKLKPLLELESGSNDPMAVFLTLGLLRLVAQPELPPSNLLGFLAGQAVFGSLIGILAGRAGLWMINRLRLGYDGLYPVLTLGLILLSYAGANLLGGSGFLAVYLTGLVLGSADFLHKQSLIRFYDGFAWLMQIILFLTLGLLVFPSRLLPVALPALGVALALIFLARPIAVGLSLLPFRLGWRQTAFVGWTGLRGAVPIVLATYPYQGGLASADLIFNVVFFVVLTSVLFQGTSIPWMARRLGLSQPDAPSTPPVQRGVIQTGDQFRLCEIHIPPGSPAAGKAVYELGLPSEYLLILVQRGGTYILPNGATLLQAGDVIQALAPPEAIQQAEAILGK